LQTSGHILEWLAFSVPDEVLDEPNMVRAVDYLAGILLDHSSRQWSIGPLGHAVHALAMYNERAFGESASRSRSNIAIGPSVDDPELDDILPAAERPISSRRAAARSRDVSMSDTAEPEFLSR
jgi:hypothetical protein